MEPIGSISPQKISSLRRFAPRFYLWFFIGCSSAPRPFLQLNFRGKEDLIVLCILVEANWHLM